MDYRKEYSRWLEHATLYTDALKAMDDAQIEDAFYRDLEFGTAGLRGVIGAGTNRMNEYTVAKASQGLATYVVKNYPNCKKIAISYDSRIKSDVFSKVAAEVFAANGIEVMIYPNLMPVPCAAFATRYYQCAAGVMITASHNPAKYNGYKVYGPDGCQITTEGSEAVLAEIEKLDIFSDVKRTDFDAAVKSGLVKFVGEDCYTAFIDEIKKLSVLYGDEIDRDVAIVYSPLNGSGLKPVTRILKECGFTNITVVKEQENPDGNFPTCPYPNPEIREALSLGLEYSKRVNADLMLATDPDADRVGIAVRDGEDMRLVTGNEVGMLLFDYICSQKVKHGKMPKNPILIKTIVSSDMPDQIAAHYGVQVINVLTGFKFIGEQIGLLEKKGETERYLMGFEESYGYLTGSHVRDKDAVNASMMICEMFAYYKTRGISIVDKLNELYKTYGYCQCTTRSYEFPGSTGLAKMANIMEKFRAGVEEFGGRKVLKTLDYDKGLDGLPKSNVLKYRLEGNSSLIARPSGTEPKLKIYTCVSAQDKAAAEALTNLVQDAAAKIINS
ncbi:MAG: phospho-sugar mutase [Sphaerochaetaceae bacterium]|nr:phospho-sugar mutase [Sphaerochaetaceae bacterium]